LAAILFDQGHYSDCLWCAGKALQRKVHFHRAIVSFLMARAYNKHPDPKPANERRRFHSGLRNLNKYGTSCVRDFQHGDWVTLYKSLEPLTEWYSANERFQNWLQLAKTYSEQSVEHDDRPTLKGVLSDHVDR
jgi:hypothetical protein